MTHDERDDWGDDGGLRSRLDAYADARLRPDPAMSARSRARVMAEARAALDAPRGIAAARRRRSPFATAHRPRLRLSLLAGAWLLVALVAAGAGLLEVGRHHGRARVVGLLDVVHPVTVGAHRGEAHARAALLALLERRRHAVEVGEVGVDHPVRQAVLGHELLVGVAAAADLGGAARQRAVARVGGVVGPVAVGADRDVVVRVHRAAVHALREDRRLLGVAAGAHLGGAGAGLAGALDVVRAVAVDAEGRLLVPLRHHREVHAVEGLGVVREVAALALLVVGDRHLAAVLELELAGGVVAGLVGVALGAAQRLSVHRGREGLLVHEERELLPARQGEGLIGIAVAAEAVLLLRGDSGPGRRRREGEEERDHGSLHWDVRPRGSRLRPNMQDWGVAIPTRERPHDATGAPR